MGVPAGVSLVIYFPSNYWLFTEIVACISMLLFCVIVLLVSLSNQDDENRNEEINNKWFYKQNKLLFSLLSFHY